MSILLQILLLLAAAYLVGSIPSAVWFSKLFFQDDVREHGSGNAGATNILRTYGAKAALPVLLIDILKGLVATQLYRFADLTFFAAEDLYLFKILLGLVAIVGHLFPIMAGFRGGKGVATFFGVVVGLHLPIALVSLAIFTVVVVLTRFVSLGSILASLALPLFIIFKLAPGEPLHAIISAITSLMLILMHRGNIKRLLTGNENKLRLKKKDE